MSIQNKDVVSRAHPVSPGRKTSSRTTTVAERDWEKMSFTAAFPLWCGELDSGIFSLVKHVISRHLLHYKNPSNTIHWPNVELMLAHRLRRWPNINPTFVHGIVFAGKGTGMSRFCRPPCHRPRHWLTGWPMGMYLLIDLIDFLCLT